MYNVMLSLYVISVYTIEIPEEYDIVYPEKIIASDLKQIKNLLYPKRFKSRIPAKPGPGKDLELFRSVMGVVMQLNVKVCYT